MKAFSLLLFCLLCAGCDYTVSLCPEPKTDVDPAWTGLWETKTEGGETVRLLLLPLGKREFMMSYPAGKDDAMFARACRTEAGGTALMQITWFGTAKGAVPDDGKVYQYASVDLKDGKLTVRMINSETAGGDARTPAELTAAITAAKDNPKLYREEMVFTKVPE